MRLIIDLIILTRPTRKYIQIVLSIARFAGTIFHESRKQSVGKLENGTGYFEGRQTLKFLLFDSSAPQIEKVEFEIIAQSHIEIVHMSTIIEL